MKKYIRKSANLTGEADWDTEVPSIRLSRAFLVVLLLHIVAVGGILLFELVGGKEKPSPAGSAANSQVAEPVEPSLPVAGMDALAEERAILQPEASGPAAEAATPVAAAEGPGSSAAALSHRLEAGESLWALSRKYEVSVQEILSANGLTMDDASRLQVGQLIVIPNR
ncbi:MAG: LysM peptidoglycan-binding domain-containing protein [Verrucomicrobiota bacterium]